MPPLRFYPVPYLATEQATDYAEQSAVADLYRRAHSQRWRAIRVTERSLSTAWGLSGRRIWALLDALAAEGLIEVERGGRRKQTRITVRSPVSEPRVQQNEGGATDDTSESDRQGGAQGGGQGGAQGAATSLRLETETETETDPLPPWASGWSKLSTAERALLTKHAETCLEVWRELHDFAINLGALPERADAIATAKAAEQQPAAVLCRIVRWAWETDHCGKKRHLRRPMSLLRVGGSPSNLDRNAAISAEWEEETRPSASAPPMTLDQITAAEDAAADAEQARREREAAQWS